MFSNILFMKMILNEKKLVSGWSVFGNANETHDIPPNSTDLMERSPIHWDHGSNVMRPDNF